MKHTRSFCSRNIIMSTESSRQNDSVTMILSLITGLLLAVAAESVAEGPPTREKKIYAHYMGCYPVAAAATEPAAADAAIELPTATPRLAESVVGMMTSGP